MLKFGVPVELEKTIRTIISEILSDDCSITFVRHHKKLESSAFTSEGNSHQIVISNHSIQGHPVRMIFTVLHEWAHFRQVKRGAVAPKNLSRLYDFESEAWEIARGDLDKYVDLLVYEKEFYDYRDECLQTYKRSINRYPIASLIFELIYQGAIIVLEVAIIKYTLLGILTVMGIYSLPEIQKLNQESIKPLTLIVLVLLAWQLSGSNVMRNLSRLFQQKFEMKKKSMSKSYL